MVSHSAPYHCFLPFLPLVPAEPRLPGTAGRCVIHTPTRPTSGRVLLLLVLPSKSPEAVRNQGGFPAVWGSMMAGGLWAQVDFPPQSNANVGATVKVTR